MESILPALLALVGIPLLGVIVSAVLIFSAKKELEMGESLPVQPAERASRTAKLLVFLAIGASKVMYGLMQLLLLLGPSGARDALTTSPVNLVMYCAVCAVLNLAAVLANGVLAADGIKNGALTAPAVFSRSVIKVMLPEVIAILGLVYATVTIMH